MSNETKFNNDKIWNLKSDFVVKLKNPNIYKQYPYYVYHAYIDILDLPNDISTEVNPRETNMKTNVARSIKDGLLDNPEMFYLNNRGIVISAKSAELRGRNLTVNLGNDNSIYGILDGGHTYQTILDNREKIDKEKAYVHIEIITKISDLEPIDSLASARNHSVQVNDKAIAELAGNFQFVKDAIQEEDYANRIAYKQNQESDKYDIDATDIIRLMFAMNSVEFPKDSLSQPIQAYSGKSYVLKKFLESLKNEEEGNPSPYKELALLLPKMITLYDKIETEIPSLYRILHGKNSKFGNVKGVELRSVKSKFLRTNIEYSISQGLIFPIFASFRYLIQKDNNNNLNWIDDPVNIWKAVNKKLVNNTIEMSRNLGNNPQSAGKNSTLWQQNYDAVKTQYLENKAQ